MTAKPVPLPSLRFTIPGPPVPCARARIVVSRSHGRTRAHAFTPEKTASYEAHVRTLARVAVYQTQGWRTDWGAYSVTLRFYRAERRGDWDNLAKSVTDGLNGVAYHDDARIVHALVEVHEDPAQPRAEVVIEMTGSETIEELQRRLRREVTASRRASKRLR